jgi:hypothetical protein
MPARRRFYLGSLHNRITLCLLKHTIDASLERVRHTGNGCRLLWNVPSVIRRCKRPVFHNILCLYTMNIISQKDKNVWSKWWKQVHIGTQFLCHQEHRFHVQFQIVWEYLILTRRCWHTFGDDTHLTPSLFFRKDYFPVVTHAECSHQLPINNTICRLNVAEMLLLDNGKGN